MTTSTLAVVVATYGTEDGAAAAAKDFQAAQRAGAIDLIDAAVVVHTAGGHSSDPSARNDASR